MWKKRMVCKILLTIAAMFCDSEMKSEIKSLRTSVSIASEEDLK